MTFPVGVESGRAGIAGYDVSLTTYADIVEAMRSSKLVTVINDGTQPFRAGTVLRIEGPAHRTRRQTMGSLLRGDGQQSFHEKVVRPTIEDNITRVYNDVDSDGRPHFDLVSFASNVFFLNAASLIGLVGVDSPDAAEELRIFSEPLINAMAGHMDWHEREERVKRGLEVKQEFWDQYYYPALSHHEELKAAVAAGELAADQMPRDLLSLIVSGLDPNWTDEPELGMREAITDILAAGTSSSSVTTVWAVYDLLTWIDGDPERGELVFDDEFLSGAIQETLRLHTLVPFIWRLATEDFTLASGFNIKAGQSVLLEIEAANRDEVAFGRTPEIFDPFRQLSAKTYPYGVSFGAGRHMCYGMPAVLGNDGVHGSHGALLKALFAAGIGVDPSNSAEKVTDTLRDAWSKFPVILQPRDHGQPQ